MVQSDYQQTGKVELSNQIFTVMIIGEERPITLDNSDIMELYFVEDIFKFCMVGKLVFNDRYNFLEYGPFTGNERLSIIYSKDTNDVRTVGFDIWKVGKISQAGPGIQETNENLITIYFIDPFFSGFTLRKYSRSWSDKKYSEIMKDILNNMVFMNEITINAEESSNSTDFVMPYWFPQTAMRFLLRRAKGSRSGTGGYVCFNNTNNTFTNNLVTLNYLLEDVDRTIDTTNYVIHDRVVSGKNKILEWWISGIDKSAVPKIRGGTWRGNDSLKKELIEKQYLYQDGVSQTIMLGRKTLYNNISDIQSSNITLSDSSIEDLGIIAYNDWCKRYNLQMLVNIIVEGNEKRFAGKQIELEWKSSTFEQYNDLLKGKYLIKSVTHDFSPGYTIPYRQRLVLIKNAYHDSKSKVLVNSSNTNIFTEKYQQIIRR